MNKSDAIRFEAVLKRIPSDTGRILDVGCARHSEHSRDSGNLHEQLIKNTDAEVVGIDILDKEIEKMQREGYDVQTGDAEEFSSSNTFEAIVAGEVIEHVKNPGRFLQNMGSNLQEGGTLVLTTPNPDGFAYFRKALFQQLGNETHTCWIDPRNLKQLVSIIEGSLIVSEWEYLPPVGGISSVLWKLGFKRAASPGYVASLTV